MGYGEKNKYLLSLKIIDGFCPNEKDLNCRQLPGIFKLINFVLCQKENEVLFIEMFKSLLTMNLRIKRKTLAFYAE